MEALADAVACQAKVVQEGLTVRDFSTHQGKNIIGCIVSKKHFLDWLLNQASILFPHVVSQKLAEVFGSFASFRALRPISGEAPALPWLAEWPLGARLFLDYVSDVVFSLDYPYMYAFQTVSRQGRCATAVLEFTNIKEPWEKVKRVVEDAAKD